MIRRPPRSTLSSSSAASDVYKRQVQERRLAGSRRSADRDDLARLDDEVEIAQDLGLTAVGEVHGLEAHGERAGRQRSRVGRLRQGLDSLEPRKAAAGRRERPLAEVRDPAERLQGPDELEQERLEEDELANRERAGDHLSAAEEDDGCDRERREVIEPRQVPRLDAGLP